MMDDLDPDDPEFFAPVGPIPKKINLVNEQMKRIIKQFQTIQDSIDANAIFEVEEINLMQAQVIPTKHITFRIDDVKLQNHYRCKGEKKIVR